LRSSGIQRSAGSSSPGAAAATPISEYGTPSRSSVDPGGASPRVARQNAGEAITTAGPFSTCSSGANERPATGGVPSTWKKPRETLAIPTRWGSPRPVRFTQPPRYAAIPARSGAPARSSSNSGQEKLCSPPAPGSTSCIATSRDAAGNGSGRTSMALTRLKMEVEAPMATASVASEIAVVAGLLRSMRIANRKS
jgi:hypothetical protein